MEMSTSHRNIGEVARSSILEFHVGVDKTTFFIHADLIEDGGIIAQRFWSRAKLGLPMEIHDCDADTFARFVEFLYTTQYAAAAPEPRCMPCEISADSSVDGKHTPEEPPEAEEPQSDGSCGPFGKSEPEATIKLKNSKKLPAQDDLDFGWRRQKPTISLRQHAWRRFKTMTLPATPTVAKPPTYATMPNPDPYEDHSEALLSHAKLHAFAVLYEIADLQHLSINRLHEALIKFIVHPECAGDIARLMRYSYTQIPGESRDYELEDLVVKYAACHVETLAPNYIFRSVMRDCNEAAVDLLEQLVPRLDTMSLST